MTSLWMVARRLAGATRGSMLTLIALVAIVSGFVQFGVAAARRTENSYDRFVAWAQPATLSTGGGPEELGNLGDLLPRVNSLPGIDDWGRFDGVSAGWIELTPGRRTYAPRLNVNAVVTKPSDPTHGRLKLIAGTIPKDDSIHEVLTDFVTAQTFGLEVGDQFSIVMSENIHDPAHRIDTPWPVRLAGIVSLPGAFPTIAGYSFATLLLPVGFSQAHPEWLDPSEASEQIWLSDGVDGVDRFASGMAAIGLGEIDLQVNAVYYSGANKVVHLQAFGLWLAAGIAAAAGTVVIAQVLVRQRTRAAHQLRIGSALGMTNRQAVLGAGCNDGISALIGACLGVALSIALSPLAPFGLARKAEPEPGIRLDGTVALIGLAATVVVVVGIGSLCTFVLLRRNGMRSDAGAEASGRSRVGSMLTEPVATGWRMAFSSGRAIAVSLIPPVLTVIALVVVATSVHNVVALPHHTELSGGSWDAFINREDYEDPSQAAVTEHLLATTPEVSAWARGGWIDVVIGATDVFTQVLEPGRGVEPSITRGRAPVGTNEIALGRKVLDQLGKDVGDTVTLDLSDRGGGQQSFDVVGEVIVASPLFQTLLPDAGALVSDRAYDKWLYEQPLAYLVAFRDGVTPTQGLDAVYAGYPDLGPFAFTRTARGDVVALDSMVALPWVLVVFLGLLTLASLVQWSVITSRRERHRAAVLRALGLTGAQVTAAFVIAALLVAGVAAVLGTVLGIAAAGAVWDVVAGWLIVVPRATVPWSVCVVALATMMLSALALAAIAGRRHAGSPAPQLRVE